MGVETNSLAVVVLAAGQGKRFKSDLPKVLHEANGSPLIEYVLRAVEAVGSVDRLLVVVGRDSERVIEAVREVNSHVEFVDQPDRLGTGDAVKRTADALKDFRGAVLVIPGDTPLISSETIQRIVDEHSKAPGEVTLLTARLEDPTGYGRVVRSSDGLLSRIVEESDADAAIQSIDEVATGIWCFDSGGLFEVLEKITPNNAQEEYYLTDAAFIISAGGGMINTFMTPDSEEVLGVNNRGQLADAARRLRFRIIDRLAAAGVTVEDPHNTYIEDGIEIGADTVIKPNTYLEGVTQVGKGCVLGPNTRIVDSIVEDEAEITFAVVRGSHVGPGATVGPYASLRPGTRLGPGTKVGTFVEIKGSIIGEGSKVPHLSYIGDAEVGRDVNLGAGTITGNYDTETKTKSKTVVEDGAFTGSDTTLIAPVTVGKDGGTGAGSVVTKDVSPGEIVAGVPARPMRKRKPRPV